MAEHRQRIFGRTDSSIDGLKLRSPVAEHDLGTPEGSHEHQAFFVPSYTDASREAKQRRVLNKATRLLEHFAVQSLAPILAGLRPARRQIPVFPVVGNEDEVAPSRNAHAGGAMVLAIRRNIRRVPGLKPVLAAAVVQEFRTVSGCRHACVHPLHWSHAVIRHGFRVASRPVGVPRI